MIYSCWDICFWALPSILCLFTGCIRSGSLSWFYVFSNVFSFWKTLFYIFRIFPGCICFGTLLSIFFVYFQGVFVLGDFLERLGSQRLYSRLTGFLKHHRQRELRELYQEVLATPPPPHPASATATWLPHIGLCDSPAATNASVAASSWHHLAAYSPALIKRYWS